MTDTVNVPREPTPEMWSAGERAFDRDPDLHHETVLANVWTAMTAAAPKAEPLHDSDCALHNEPAYPNGPCDCAAKPVATLDEDDVKRARELRHAPDSEDNERFSSWFGDTLLDVHEAYVKMITHPEAPKVEQEPFGYWVKHRVADSPVFLIKGSYLPRGYDYSITPLYTQSEQHKGPQS